jgi:flavin reductase (DIM6/NTAB) family NADH-FMN oxidoreductase RutF
VTHLVIRPTVLYVGTPVMLLGSTNGDGTANLAAASSYWALGQVLVIGLEDGGKTIDNVTERPHLTVNFPGPELWPAVESIADTTGASPVPADKAHRYHYVADKFSLAGLTATPADLVSPPLVAECKLQLETEVRRITKGLGEYSIVEAEVVRVHAHPAIVSPGTHHIDPRAWEPTIYSFRHYFGIGEEHGHRPTSDAAGSSALSRE